jgi:hypothetical protein
MGVKSRMPGSSLLRKPQWRAPVKEIQKDWGMAKIRLAVAAPG